MQYHHRSRLPPPPPPPPFGRGGGAGYPRGHMQLYAPPPPPPRPPLPSPPPQRRYEVLMEAGRLAAEYLVSKGVLPPSSLQRGGAAWVTPPPPPPPPPPSQQQQEEPPAFYGRRRYEDVHSNNHSSRPRRSSSSSSSSRDDYSSGGSYNARGKRKYGEYRKGYSDWGREREERGRSISNGRRYEDDDDDDGAPGFRRDRRNSVGNDDVRSCVTEGVREATPLMMKPVVESEMEDTRSKAVSSSGDVRKEADAQPDVQGENEQGEMKEDKVSSPESEVVEQGMKSNVAVKKTSGIVIEAEAKHLPDGKLTDEKTEENDKVVRKTSLNCFALDDEATDLENTYVDMRNMLNHRDFAKAPTRPRSVRAHRNAASVHSETETADLVSSGEASQMVVNEAANGTSLTNIQSDNRDDQIYQENTGSSSACNEIMELVLLQEDKISVVTKNMREDENDVQLHAVQEYKEETDVSPLKTCQKDTLMQETDLSPLIASPKDGLMQETNISSMTSTHVDSLTEQTNISLLTDSHKDSLSKETKVSPSTESHNNILVEQINLSPLTDSRKDSLMQETDLSQTMSLHEKNFNLQFNEADQMSDIEMLPRDEDLINFSDQRKIIGAELFSNVEAETVIKMEDQSSSLKMHNNPELDQSYAEGSSAEPHKQQRQDFVASAGDNVSGTDDLCQVSLDNKAVQVIDIEDDAPTELVGFDSSKAKNSLSTRNETICSNMDGMMHPGLHTDDLPVIQDGYNLVISDYLGTDLPCYTSIQPDLQSGICTSGSEGIHVMDDSIYGSLTDIGWCICIGPFYLICIPCSVCEKGFMDVWGQPADDFEKFF